MLQPAPQHADDPQGRLTTAATAYALAGCTLVVTGLILPQILFGLNWAEQRLLTKVMNGGRAYSQLALTPASERTRSSSLANSVAAPDQTTRPSSST